MKKLHAVVLCSLILSLLLAGCVLKRQPANEVVVIVTGIEGLPWVADVSLAGVTRQTDPVSGGAVFTNIGAGTYELVVVPEKYHAEWVGQVKVEGREQQVFEVELEPTISGNYLVGQVSGASGVVSGASVEFGGKSTTTDEAGIYVLEGITTGPGLFKASANGFFPYLTDLVAEIGGQRCDVDLSDTIVFLDFSDATYNPGDWLSDDALLSRSSDVSLSGGHSLKITIPKQTSYGYAKTRFAGLDATDWEALDVARVVLWIRGDGGNSNDPLQNFVRIGLWEAYEYGQEDWYAGGEPGFTGLAVSSAPLGVGYYELPKDGWKKVEIDLSQLQAGSKVGNGNGRLDVSALRYIVFEIFAHAAGTPLTPRTFYVDSIAIMAR